MENQMTTNTPLNMARIFYGISFAFTVLSFALAPSPASGAANDRDKFRFMHELQGNQKICHERALKRIRETGRTYDAERLGWNEREGLFNIWIGEYLFKVPKDYVNIISGGYPDGTAGISALLVGAMPDLSPTPNKAYKQIEGFDPDLKRAVTFDPMTKIRLTCDPRATVSQTSKLSQSSILESYFLGSNGRKIIEQQLPEFGLVGYWQQRGARAIYFPADNRIRNPHGGVLALNCHDTYPPKRWPGARPECTTEFTLRDGVQVNFEIPEHYLKDWKTSYQKLLSLLNEFLVKE